MDQPNSRGVHRLLREGAAVCESAADVLCALGVEVPGADAASGADGASAVPRAADPLEQRLIHALAEEDLDADQLLDRTGAPSGAGLAALTSLELRGAVRVGGDGNWSLVRKR